jgi:hypothetical protein
VTLLLAVFKAAWGSPSLKVRQNATAVVLLLLLLLVSGEGTKEGRRANERSKMKERPKGERNWIEIQ